MSLEILYLKSKTNIDCQICDKCCKHRGDIRLTPVNVVEISKFLKCSIEDFLYLYTDNVKGQEPEIVLKTIGREKLCIFNDSETNKCMIQKVKPMQCVVFPLVPVDLKQDFFTNSGECKVKTKKQVSVNRWLNGNNNIYKRHKESTIEWTEFLEEYQPIWKNLTKKEKRNIDNLLYYNYNYHDNVDKQMHDNIQEAKKILDLNSRIKNNRRGE